MSHKMYSVAILLLVFSTSLTVASEEIVYDRVENTFSIPSINVDDQVFYYLELSRSVSEAEIRYNIEEAREIDPQSNSNAYFSSATSRLSLANVDVDGSQWIYNLDLDQGSLQFIIESTFLPILDAEGKLSEIEYIDNTLEHYTYRFNEAGRIDHIETDWLVYSFRQNGDVGVYANYGGPAPYWGTHAADLDADDIGSAVSLYYFFRAAVETHLSELTSDQQDYTVISDRSTNYQSIANALAIPSWLFECASATVSNESWEPIVMACEAPPN